MGKDGTTQTLTTYKTSVRLAHGTGTNEAVCSVFWNF
jgi:hypothetical protein